MAQLGRKEAEQIIKKILTEYARKIRSAKKKEYAEDTIRNFVVNNAYALDKVADQLMWLDEFWNIRIRGGGKATDEEIQELKNKTDEYVKKHENDK